MLCILGFSPLIPKPCQQYHHLSAFGVLTGSSLLSHKNPPLYLPFRPRLRFPSIIRMGGGPRTYPGGVSKWQWKRMQAKKSKQLLKARLCRERQIYEMRKRAELRAAVTELERPWEVVERAPTLFSVSADEQLKTLADRFQRPGGYDLWSQSDGPQIFHPPDTLPSARFFPKGVVHSVKPYGRVGADTLEGEEEEENNEFTSHHGRKGWGRRRRSLPSSSTVELNDSQEGDSFGYEAHDRLLETTSTSMKNLSISNSRDEMKTDMEQSNYVDRRKMFNGGRGDFSSSREERKDFFNGGRGRNDSLRGNFRNKGKGRNVVSRDSNTLESERGRFGTDGRGEIPLSHRGRAGSNSFRQFNNEKYQSRSSKYQQAREVYEDGRGEIPLSQRGRAGSNSVRQFKNERYQLRSSKYPQAREVYEDGRGEIPLSQRGRASNSDRQFKNERYQSRSSKYSQAREVYDMSLKHDGTYELQINHQKDFSSVGLDD